MSSKIGEQSVQIPAGATVELKDDVMHVKSGVNMLAIPIPDGITALVKPDSVTFTAQTSEKRTKALHGLIRSLVANAVAGVVTPWQKTLKIVGTGFRVKQQGESLVFEVGYSHTVPFEKTEGITLSVAGSDTVIVSGADKQKVGEVAFKIRSIRKPDAYKGKGIRYEGEYLKLKPGKKAKTA